MPRSGSAGVTVDLTPEECARLIILLTIEIEASKYPLSPRIGELKRIRAKLRGEAAPQPLARSVKRKSRE
jgi:hypothetical protein